MLKGTFTLPNVTFSAWFFVILLLFETQRTDGMGDKYGTTDKNCIVWG